MRWFSRLLAYLLCLSLANAQSIGPGGGGSGGGGGGVTSFSTVCPTSGPSTGAVTVTNGIATTARSPVSGSTDTTLTGDCGELTKYTGTTTVTVPQAGSTGFPAGYTTNLILGPSAVLTLSTTTSVFSNTGTTSTTISGPGGFSLNSDGTNWNLAVTKTPPNGFAQFVNNSSAWFTNPSRTGVTSSATGAVNSYYCTPFWVNAPSIHIQALSIHVVATSTGNGSEALAGAIFANQVTTANLNRPGTLIDFTTTPFATGSAAAVSSALSGGGGSADVLNGPALYWTCVQKFDTTATYEAMPLSTNMFPSLIGTTSLTNAMSNTNALDGVSITGSTFNSWASWSSSTSFTEITTALAPDMAIEIFSVP